MPCIGPALPTDEEVQTVTTDILNLLKEKYQIFSSEVHGTMLDARNKTIEELSETVRDILKQESYETF